MRQRMRNSEQRKKPAMEKHQMHRQKQQLQQPHPEQQMTDRKMQSAG